MIFRGSTLTDDWTFGRGKQSYLKGEAAIIANLKTKLSTFFSELFFAPNFGMEWFSLLGQKTPEPLVLAVKSAILESYGIVAVRDIQFKQGSDRALTVRFVVDTVNSTQVAGEVTI